MKQRSRLRLLSNRTPSAPSSPSPPSKSNVAPSSQLTAFEIQKEITQKELSSDEICALTVCGNRIYLATKSGRMSIFEEVNVYDKQNDNKKGKSIKRCFVKHKKSKEFKKAKNIREMVVCHDLNILIMVLHNGHYLYMDAKNLVVYTDNNSLIPKNKTKNAEQIVSQFRPPLYRFAICSKKNVYIFDYEKKMAQYALKREISIGEQCISALFYNSYFCYSTHKKGFLMYNITNAKEDKINVPSMPNNIPRMCKISHHDDDYKMHSDNDGYLLVQASPNLGIFIDKSGNPAQKDTVNWSGTPLFIIDCLQYMVGYLDSGLVEVVSLVDQKSVQQIHVNITHNNDENNIRGLFKTTSNHVIMYDNFEVISLVPTPIQKQISQCIKYLRIEKGLQLLIKQSPTQEELRAFHGESAFALLCNLEWKRAMEHFEISDVDPRDIIYLFPKMKLEIPYEIQHLSAPTSMIDQVILKVLKYKRSHANVSNINSNIDEEKNNEYLNGVYYLGQFLWKRRSDPSSGLEIVDAESKLCVDTALLKVYVELKTNNYYEKCPFSIEDLFDPDSPNSCLEKESEKLLITAQLYYNLAMFYRSKNKVQKALLTLHKIGKTQEWIGDIAKSVSLSIEILKDMPDCQDLWTYSAWILTKNPRKAMSIFTGNYHFSSKFYDKIRSYLKEDIAANINDYNDIVHFDYEEYYLEHIVIVSNCSISKYHDDLAYLYMKKIQKLNENNENGKYNNKLNDTREKLLNFLTKSDLYLPEKLLAHAKTFKLYDEIVELNKKLKNHNAVLYTLVIDKKDHNSALEYCLEAPPLSKDRSDRFLELLRLYLVRNNKDNVDDIVYDDAPDIVQQSDLQPTRHRQTSTLNLDLLSESLLNPNDEFGFYNDDENNTVTSDGGMNFDFDDEQKKTDLMPILDEKSVNVSLNKSDIDEQLFFDKGTDILWERAFDMDYLQVLNMLPSSMDITYVMKYLQKIIPGIIHSRRITQIRYNLHKRQYMRQRVELAKVKSQFIRMNNQTLCCKCNKPIGSSVLILDPKKFKKYHYSCFYRNKRKDNTENITYTTQHLVDDMDEMNDMNDMNENNITISSKRQKQSIDKASLMDENIMPEPFLNPFIPMNDSTDQNTTNPFANDMNNQSNNPFGDFD